MKKRTSIIKYIYFLIYLMAFAITVKGSFAQAKTKSASFGTPKQLRARSYEENRICLKWKPVTGADGYQIYRYRNSTQKFEKVKTVGAEQTKWVSGKTKAKRTYKIRAFRKKKNGKRKYSGFTYEVSAIPYKKNAKVVNAGKVVPSDNSFTLGVCDTAKLTAKVKVSKYAKNKKAELVDDSLKWYSTDPEIAIVKDGELIPQGKYGKCNVYARAHNGNYTGTIWVNIKNYARPKMFEDEDAMQKDMRKLVKECRDDIYTIAQFFAEVKAKHRNEIVTFVARLDESRSWVKTFAGDVQVDYKKIEDNLFRVLDAYPGKAEINVYNIGMAFRLYGNQDRVELRHGFEEMPRADGSSRYVFSVAERWTYAYVPPGV